MPRIAWAAGLLPCLATLAAHAEPCEPLRQQIEAKIRASGVARFNLAVLDASAPSSGKVVGNCELGMKKIVYQQLPAAGAAASAPASSAARQAPRRRDAEPIVTECKDGTVVKHVAECKH